MMLSASTTLDGGWRLPGRAAAAAQLAFVVAAASLLDEWSSDDHPGDPHERNRDKEREAMPAPQPQATVIAIQPASTVAIITPRPDTTLGSLSFAGALRQSNRKRSKRR